ncbi:transcriptional regulator, LuxR family [Roseivivax marinus]|uniref:autoinducer binding domain-containing protein n=1 Tax=Roseivivax marinus TaxID=1379903 RepID=UPI0008C21CD1|nr:autoinducer binding domain-containing protein [Roseivivax marinus]SEL34678.1 transcriptional regulator, LuxR family [Roseivivax marinus]
MQLIDLAGFPGRTDHFDTFLLELCDQLEFDYASYAVANPITRDVQGYATYPDEWKTHYGSRGFHEFDPTLHKASRSVAPVDWGRLARDDDFVTLFSEATDFGISDRGLTVPIRGPMGECGLLSVTRDCSDREWIALKTEVMPRLQHAAVHLHDAVMRTDPMTAALNRFELSQREREVLQWAALGKTQQDIADIVGISHRTVEVHLRSARTKLSALTTPQAVGRGIALGLIEAG